MKSGTCDPKWNDNGLMAGKIMIAFVNTPEWRGKKTFWYAKALNEDGVLSFIGSYETREAAMIAVEVAAGMQKVMRLNVKWFDGHPTSYLACNSYFMARIITDDGNIYRGWIGDRQTPSVEGKSLDEVKQKVEVELG